MTAVSEMWIQIPQSYIYIVIAWEQPFTSLSNCIISVELSSVLERCHKGRQSLWWKWIILARVHMHIPKSKWSDLEFSLSPVRGKYTIRVWCVHTQTSALFQLLPCLSCSAANHPLANQQPKRQCRLAFQVADEAGEQTISKTTSLARIANSRESNVKYVLSLRF